MIARRHTLVLVLVLVAAAFAAPSAAAKDFQPGDLRLCGASGCAPLENAGSLKLLANFYYSDASPPKARPPRLGAPAFELRFTNGYVTGIVATTNLDRFLSYGVNLGHFRRGAWYRLPARAALELRRLAATLHPLRVTRSALARSR